MTLGSEGPAYLEGGSFTRKAAPSAQGKRPLFTHNELLMTSNSVSDFEEMFRM